MNESNNIFDSNSTSNMSQLDNTTGANQMQEANNLNNSANSKLDANSIFDSNVTSNISKSDTPEINSNISDIELQNNYNTQIKNTTVNNNIDQTSVNPILTDNTSTQQTIQSNQNPNSNVSIQQNYTIGNQINDDELLRTFIGNNYQKITTRTFNIAGFFFNSLYMCYRKMIGYGVLVFLLYIVIYNIINYLAPSLLIIWSMVFFTVIGFFVNKIYLAYAKKKIAIIKTNNPQKSNEELKIICATQGGTSVGKIFLGLLAEIVTSLIVLIIMGLIGIGTTISNILDINNWDITITNERNTTEVDSNIDTSKNGILLENVVISGYSCTDSKCNATVESTDGNSENYVLGISNSDFFNKLGNYKDYIRVDIFYTKKGKSKTIGSYKIYLKSNNEDISNVSTENELRDKIGLYSLGTHTEILTLKEIGTTGFGLSDNISYTYTEYIFIDSKNNEYEMKYIDGTEKLDLTEGQKYNVTFEVSEGTFDYEFTIKSIN